MGISLAELGKRPAHYNTFVPFHQLHERAIIALSPQINARRTEALGASFLEAPGVYLERVRSDLQVGPLLQLGSRAAGGLRKHLYHATQHGQFHEQARKGKNTRAHGEEHERRLRSWVREELSDPALRLHSKLLYYVPDAWIHMHDADQLDGEAAGLAKPKHAHDFAAALEALVYTERFQYESKLPKDDARIVTGVIASLSLYHDEPKIQQKLLTATESEGGAKAYETLENGFRRYYSAEELITIMEDDSLPGIDLFSLQDWQIADMTRLKKSKIPGLVTETTPFGLDERFERDFKTELSAIAIPNNGSLYLTPEQGDAHALVPERLLQKMKPQDREQFRIDTAMLGDILRIADQMDMIAPAALAMTRKWEVRISRERPLYRQGLLDRILHRESKLEPAEDSDIGRGLWETWNALQSIRPQEGQLRPALEVSKTVRDRLYLLHIENIRTHKEIMPLLMHGGRLQRDSGPDIPQEEQDNRQTIEQAIQGIFEADLIPMARKFLGRSRIKEPDQFIDLPLPQYLQSVQDLLLSNGHHEYAQQLQDIQSGLKLLTAKTMEYLDEKNNGEGLTPYPQYAIDDVLETCETLEALALAQYKAYYGEELDIRDLPRPFKTYHSTAAAFDPHLERVPTLRSPTRRRTSAAA